MFSRMSLRLSAKGVFSDKFCDFSRKKFSKPLNDTFSSLVAVYGIFQLRHSFCFYILTDVFFKAYPVPISGLRSQQPLCRLLDMVSSEPQDYNREAWRWGYWYIYWHAKAYFLLYKCSAWSWYSNYPDHVPKVYKSKKKNGIVLLCHSLQLWYLA